MQTLHGGPALNLALIGQADFMKKLFENGRRRRRTDANTVSNRAFHHRKRSRGLLDIVACAIFAK